MSRGRDNQRTKLYRAEHAALENYKLDFRSLREAQKYANSVTASKWWRQVVGGSPFVLVTEGRSDSNTSQAWGTQNKIRLAPSHFQKWVLLHELSHVALHRIARNQSSHGPEYALLYRRMVEQFLGEDKARKLAHKYEEYGVSDATASSPVLQALGRAL